MRDKNKKKPKRYKQYRLRMSDAEDARLKRLSEETGMSCADVMRDALERYMGEHSRTKRVDCDGMPSLTRRSGAYFTNYDEAFEDDLK